MKIGGRLAVRPVPHGRSFEGLLVALDVGDVLTTVTQDDAGATTQFVPART